MSTDITRAWKDEIYRQSLDDEQLRSLPAHPAGELELTDIDLQSVSGGCQSNGGYGYGDWYGQEGQYINSQAYVCENPVFSINNIKDVSHADIHITNICVFVIEE